jgi:hypothetical protein
MGFIIAEGISIIWNSFCVVMSLWVGSTDLEGIIGKWVSGRLMG